MTTASPTMTDLAAWQSYAMLQNAVDALGDPFFAKDLQHRWVVCNQAFCTLMGKTLTELLGRSDPDFVPAEQAAVFWRGDDAVTATGEAQASEETITTPDSATRYIWTRKWPMRDQDGRITGLCATITDITEIKRRQEQVQRLEAEIKEQLTIIETQGALLDELSVPVIQVWTNVLLLPLIGIIESRRAARVLETLLEAVGRMDAEFVVIDITGVPVVDTAVASYLLRAVQATQLLGCQSILVGISPEIAQTLVGLGVDFSRITTRATLQNGLEYAFRQIDETKQRLPAGR